MNHAEIGAAPAPGAQARDGVLAAPHHPAVA